MCTRSGDFTNRTQLHRLDDPRLVLCSPLRLHKAVLADDPQISDFDYGLICDNYTAYWLGLPLDHLLKLGREWSCPRSQYHVHYELFGSGTLCQSHRLGVL